MKRLILFFMSFFVFTNIYALEINSKNVILYNLNDSEVIYEKNSDEKVQVASLTKIVTAITIIENVDNLNKEVIISEKMLKGLEGYAIIGLKPGDKLTYLDLLYALMLPSAADAAQSLAVSFSGDIDSFVTLMNKQIEKIGLINSKFDNPIGKDSDNNYSTAKDIAQLLQYCLKNPVFETIFNSNFYTISGLDKNIKKTVISYGVDTSIIKGAKTGFTYGAGLCLASTSVIDDINYLLVTLGAKVGTLEHVQDTINIYNFYGNNYGYVNILTDGQLLHTISVKDSRTKNYNIYSKDTVKLYLEKSSNNNLKYEYVGIEELSKQVRNGDKIGIVNVIDDDKIIYTYDIYLDKDINYYNYSLYTILVLIIVIIEIFILKKVFYDTNA